MLYYLPEVHDYFKFYPSKRLLVEEGALLTNKVPEMNFLDYEDSSPKITTQGNDDINRGIGISNNMKKKKSDPKFSNKPVNPKLREA